MQTQAINILAEINSSSSSETSGHVDITIQSFGSNPQKPRSWEPPIKERKHHPTAWFVSVLGGLSIALIVLGTNIGVLFWVRSHFGVVNNIAVLFNGSCSKASSITSYIELAVNVLSTLLLAASNNCSQLLVSPTRAEVDKAHAKGEWVHVGTASFRNFKWINPWRITLWGLLFCSSIPLHLL